MGVIASGNLRLVVVFERGNNIRIGNVGLVVVFEGWNGIRVEGFSMSNGKVNGFVYILHKCSLTVKEIG